VVIAALVKEAERSSFCLEGSIMVHILAWYLLKSLINLTCLHQATDTLIDILSVDVTKAEHVVDYNKVLIELSRFLRSELDELLQRILIAPNGIAELLDLIV
jgi:hypothetical protein